MTAGVDGGMTSAFKQTKEQLTDATLLVHPIF